MVFDPEGDGMPFWMSLLLLYVFATSLFLHVVLVMGLIS